MKNWTLCAILLVTLPAFGTIANVQSNADWTCANTGSTITCSVILTTQHTTSGNLLAVWTFWETTSTYTAAVNDSILTNNFASAAGPTLQSVSNTTAQIFYAKNITGTTPPNKDTVTVTFTCVSSCTSPSITAGGVVAVEYSGLDTMYPLDSVSAGYSYSVGTYMDSGTAAPANANLLVFGGGTNDTGLASAGTGFTAIQSNGGSITEQNTTAITTNNVLQRATASVSTFPGGNWVMQMAVFRAASWGLAVGSPLFTGQNLVSNNGVFTNTQANLYEQSLIGGINPLTQYQLAQGAVYMTDAATFGVGTPSTATVRGLNAVDAQVTTACDSRVGGNDRQTCNTVALYGEAVSTAQHAAVWGGNLWVSDNGTNNANLIGLELDIGSGASPVFTQGFDVLQGGAGTAPATSVAFYVHHTGGTFNIAQGFVVDRGGIGGNNAFLADGIGFGGSNPSFQYRMNSYNATNTLQQASMSEDINGNIVMQPSAGDAYGLNTNGGGFYIPGPTSGGSTVLAPASGGANVNFPAGVSQTALVASLSTSSGTSDNVTVTGMTSTGHCTFSATNASAATNIATTYVSGKATNGIMVTHTATAGMTYDIICTAN